MRVTGIESPDIVWNPYGFAMRVAAQDRAEYAAVFQQFSFSIVGKYAAYSFLFLLSASRDLYKSIAWS